MEPGCDRPPRGGGSSEPQFPIFESYEEWSPDDHHGGDDDEMVEMVGKLEMAEIVEMVKSPEILVGQFLTHRN